MWRRCESRRSLNRTPWKRAVCELCVLRVDDFPAGFLRGCFPSFGIWYEGVFVNGLEKVASNGR